MVDFPEAFGYIPGLPENHMKSFVYLCQELAAISDKWDLYIGLFGNKDDVDILNTTAGDAFRCIEESLWADITMSISRLADPPASCGKDNLSIKMIQQEIIDIEGLSEKINNFIELSSPIITFRHKRFAHNDRNTFLNPQEKSLPPIGRKTIEYIISALADILNTISSHYSNCELCFDIPQSYGADSLLLYLRAGLEKFKKEREEALSHSKQ